MTAVAFNRLLESMRYLAKILNHARKETILTPMTHPCISIVKLRKPWPAKMSKRRSIDEDELDRFSRRFIFRCVNRPSDILNAEIEPLLNVQRVPQRVGQLCSRIWYPRTIGIFR